MISTVSALIFYISDTPSQFKYFSDPFTNRLNQTQEVRFYEDKLFENEFFLTALDLQEKSGIEQEIFSSIEMLKTKISENNIEEAAKISFKVWQNFEDKLIQYPHNISKDLLIQFYFWNGVAQLNTPKKSQKILNQFYNIATLAERDLLQGQLSPQINHLLRKSLTNYKSYTQTEYSIQGAEKCKIFLNGKQLPTNLTTVFAFPNTILGARCQNGIYTIKLEDNPNRTLKIFPQILRTSPKILPIDALPIDLLKKNKIPFFVMIHWSDKEKMIQTIVLNPNNLSDRHQLKLVLSTQADLMSAGDKIERFILSHRKNLLE